MRNRETKFIQSTTASWVLPSRFRFFRNYAVGVKQDEKRELRLNEKDTIKCEYASLTSWIRFEIVRCVCLGVCVLLQAMIVFVFLLLYLILHTTDSLSSLNVLFFPFFIKKYDFLLLLLVFNSIFLMFFCMCVCVCVLDERVDGRTSVCGRRRCRFRNHALSIDRIWLNRI